MVILLAIGWTFIVVTIILSAFTFYAIVSGVISDWFHDGVSPWKYMKQKNREHEQ